MLKKMFAFVLVITLLAAVSVTGYAAENEELVEKPPTGGMKMTYISSVYTSLSISSSGYSTSHANMTVYSGVDSGRMSMYLQRYDNGWKTVNHWTKDFTGTYSSLTHNWYVTKGYKYRVLTYFYAYDNGNSESTSLSHQRYY